MTKFDSELYPEQFEKIIGEAFEASDRQTETLHSARAHLLYEVGVVDLTAKELLLLSNYVREAISKRSKNESSQVNSAEEAAELWFHHITNYHITDFRGNKLHFGIRKQRQEPGLRPKESSLIDELREKFNRGDDTEPPKRKPGRFKKELFK